MVHLGMPLSTTFQLYSGGNRIRFICEVKPIYLRYLSCSKQNAFLCKL